MQKIKTKPTLFERIWRHDGMAAILVICWLFAFIALADLACWLIGVGAME